MGRFNFLLSLSLCFSLGLSQGEKLAFAGPAKTVFVKAPQTDVLQGPDFMSKKLLQVKRGQSLIVLKTQDTWVQVKTGQTVGWLPGFLTSDHQVVSAEELAKSEALSKENIGRRRISNRTTTGGVRGLSAEGRAREGREKFESDFGALKDMEEYKVDAKKEKAFKDEFQKATQKK